MKAIFSKGIEKIVDISIITGGTVSSAVCGYLFQLSTAGIFTKVGCAVGLMTLPVMSLPVVVFGSVGSSVALTALYLKRKTTISYWNRREAALHEGFYDGPG